MEDTITTEEAQFLERLVNSQVTLPYQLTDCEKLAGAAWSKETNAPLTKWDRLLKWQMEWKQKLKGGLKFYFDIDGVVGSSSGMVTMMMHPSSSAYSRRTINQKASIYKKKLMSHGAKIVPFLSRDPGSVDILITDSSLVAEATAEFKYLKVWDYDKLGRFLQKLELDFKTMGSGPEESRRENYQREERLQDVHYFNSKPHVYLYFILQNYRPLIKKEWDIATLNKIKDRKDLPYPVLKGSTYGRCPFVSDGSINETSVERVKKRYIRDRMNERYAVRLRRLYLRSARPDIRGASNVDTGSAFTDRQLYDYFNPDRLPTSASSFANPEKFILKRQNTAQFQFKSFSENFDRFRVHRKGNANNLDNILEGDEDTGEGNMEFVSSSDDTLETVDMSQEELAQANLCHYQHRSSLNLSGLYSSDNLPQGSDIVPVVDINDKSKIDLNTYKLNYCQNCRTFFQESISQHPRIESHQRYASDESQFAQIDKLLRVLHQ